jgi:hypothetical protein
VEVYPRIQVFLPVDSAQTCRYCRNQERRRTHFTAPLQRSLPFET